MMRCSEYRSIVRPVSTVSKWQLEREVSSTSQKHVIARDGMTPPSQVVIYLR